MGNRDRAARFGDGEYGIAKMICLNPEELLAENTVSVSFSDGNEGTVGSVVIRAAVNQ